MDNIRQFFGWPQQQQQLAGPPAGDAASPMDDDAQPGGFPQHPGCAQDHYHHQQQQQQQQQLCYAPQASAPSFGVNPFADQAAAEAAAAALLLPRCGSQTSSGTGFLAGAPGASRLHSFTQQHHGGVAPYALQLLRQQYEHQHQQHQPPPPPPHQQPVPVAPAAALGGAGAGLLLDRSLDRFLSGMEDAVTREPSFEESVAVLSHLFPNQLLTADGLSPAASFTDQGRCMAVNKRGRRQCANKCMYGSRFCRCHAEMAEGGGSAGGGPAGGGGAGGAGVPAPGAAAGGAGGGAAGVQPWL